MYIHVIYTDRMLGCVAMFCRKTNHDRAMHNRIVIVTMLMPSIVYNVILQAINKTAISVKHTVLPNAYKLF